MLKKCIVLFVVANCIEYFICVLANTEYSHRYLLRFVSGMFKLRSALKLVQLCGQ